MKDKELREEVEEIKNDLYSDICSIGKLEKTENKIKELDFLIKNTIEKLTHIESLIYGDSRWSYEHPTGIIDYMNNISRHIESIEENQKLLMDYLKVEKVNEPSKVYLKTKDKKNER